MASVTEAINEITVPRIGAKVDIQFVNETLYADRMVMNIAMGSDFDLCFSGYLNSYVDSVQNGGYLDITDYLAESEKLKSIFPDYALEGLKMEGRIYAIPNMQILTSSTGLFIQKDLAEEYGLKREDIHYLEDIEPMLEWVKQNKPDIYPFKTGRYGGGLKNENLNQSAGTWGGSRQGAGRPKTTAKSISLRVPEDVAAIIDALGRGRQAAYIVRAIRAYHESGGI